MSHRKGKEQNFSSSLQKEYSFDDTDLIQRNLLQISDFQNCKLIFVLVLATKFLVIVTAVKENEYSYCAVLHLLLPGFLTAISFLYVTFHFLSSFP